MLAILGAQLVLLLGLLSHNIRPVSEWEAASILVQAVPPLVLIVGIWGASRLKPWAQPVLVVAFPFFSVLAHASTVSSAVERSGTAYVLSVFCLVVWLLFLWMGVRFFGKIHERPQVGYKSLGVSMNPHTKVPFWKRKEALQSILVGTVSLGLLVIAALLPLSPTVVEHFGEASAPASVLVGVFAFCISGGVLGLIIAPSMRQEKRKKRVEQRSRRTKHAAVMVGLAAVAMTLLFFMQD